MSDIQRRAREELQTFAAAILVAAATGEIDLNWMAREELAARGLDRSGVWCGSFAKAKAELEAEREK